MTVTFDNTTSQYINFGDGTLAEGLTTKSILFWMRQNSYVSGGALCAIGGSPNELWWPSFNGFSNGYMAFSQAWTGSTPSWRTNASQFPTGSLIHGAITYDNTSSSNDPIFYVSGASVALTESVAPSGSAKITGATVFLVGGLGVGVNSLGADIFSICIYNRILSASEILDAYNSKLAIPDKRGLVFAPQLASNGQVGEGGTLAAGNTFADFVTGALGQPSGSPLFRQDNALVFQN